MSAMRFTKSMMCSWRTSVASGKFRMVHRQKIASTLRPGIMEFRVELSPPICCAMIPAPASPKPRARSWPILMIVFSSTTVSMGSGAGFFSPFRKSFQAFLAFRQSLRTSPRQLPSLISRSSRLCGRSGRSLRLLGLESTSLLAMVLSEVTDLVSHPESALRLCSSSSSFLCSAFWIVIAARGFFRIFSILTIIRSIGMSTSVFASLEKSMEPKPSSRHMKTVCMVFRNASS
mmetsp:Transcript_34086/g.101271  ORF Transcript_34086/g.101271 Transcript_34086/m.101271 type:complete len:232 (+) Transcript_34086:929-1624(+)